jgi:tetratricopeptide (TPR) repeat protein
VASASPLEVASLGPPSTAVATGGSPEARLVRAREALGRKRWAEALAEARAVLEAVPTSADAAALAQLAEAELVLEECLRNAKAALQQGDRERALEELRRGFLVRSNDPRLLELHRQAVQQ